MLRAGRFVEAGTKAAHEIGDRRAILLDGQSFEIEFRRMQAGLRPGRIKGLVNEGGHLGGILADARADIVIGHRAGNALGERFHRAVAVQRFVVFVRHPLALVAVALRTQFLVNRRARVRGIFRAEQRPTGHGTTGQHPGRLAAQFLKGDAKILIQSLGRIYGM